MKVVIPTAGLGSRLGSRTQFINKALLTVDHKPVIANIIDKFPSDTEFVILLGYKGDQVKQVLLAMYPEYAFQFVEVDKFEGEGSGLGYSLLCAEKYLQEPFIFVSNDSLVSDDTINHNPELYGNWIGYYVSDRDDSFDVMQYRTLEINETSYLKKINPKGVNNNNIYIGICGILDYELFWDEMHSATAIASGESYGLQNLEDVYTVKMQSWCDTGNNISLQKTKDKFSTSGINVLEKDDEAIWFRNNNVYKFSIHESFIADRVKRLETLPEFLFPKITHHSKNIYVYEKIQGEVISDKLNSISVEKLLSDMYTHLWSNRFITSDKLVSHCFDFYKVKTFDRVNLFLDKFEVSDRAEIINGLRTTKTIDLLNRVNWDDLCRNTYLSKYHGDFHCENILVDSNGEFTLIDWRQNFGKDNLDVGDAYYDFAKFYHGLIVSHHIIAQKQFNVDVNGNIITFDIHRLQSAISAESVFFDWLISHNFDVKKVKILTALIFLNVAGLHEYPYSLFLYYLGKHLLTKWL